MVRDFKGAPLWHVLWPIAATLSVGGCATPNPIKQGTASAVVATTTLPTPDARQAFGTLDDAYYLGPRDKFDVSVYQLPDMARSVEVDSAGQVNLPFVGTLEVAGKTAPEVRTEIARRLASYLQNPQVTVSVTTAASQRITLEGALETPGVYAVAGQISLIQAIAMAKGTNNVANERVVAVFRTIDNKRMAAVFDLQMIRRGELADPPIYGNDVIVVERSRGKVLLRDILNLTPLIGVYRVLAQ